MVDLLYRFVFTLLIVRLAVTLYQRRYNLNGGIKRMAGLYQSLVLGALYGVVSAIRVKGLGDQYIYGAILFVVVLFILLRKRFFPYKSKCNRCGKSLKISKILFIDSQLCSQCEN